MTSTRSRVEQDGRGSERFFFPPRAGGEARGERGDARTKKTRGRFPATSGARSGLARTRARGWTSEAGEGGNVVANGTRDVSQL
jgi:hypothetical protein